MYFQLQNGWSGTVDSQIEDSQFAFYSDALPVSISFQYNPNVNFIPTCPNSNLVPIYFQSKLHSDLIPSSISFQSNPNFNLIPASYQTSHCLGLFCFRDQVLYGNDMCVFGIMSRRQHSYFNIRNHKNAIW